MLSLLRRAEDLLIQVLRLVLLAFSIFLIIGMGRWIWDHYQSKKPDVAVATPTALNWQQAPYDLKYMEEETGRDLNGMSHSTPMEKRLADPALRPEFLKADGLLRGYIYKDVAARKRIEKDNSGQGLEPIHPLLKGDALPSADEVNRQIKMREARENSCCDKEAADAAAAEVDAAWTARRITFNSEDRIARAATQAAAEAAASAAADAAAEASGDEMLTDAVNLASEINDRAQAAEMEHGEGAYAAYLKGLPAALQAVLGNEKLASKLQQQSASQIVTTLMTNYTLSFDRTAMKIRGDNPDAEKWEFLGIDTAFATMLISCLVMVMMALVMIRIERHMRSSIAGADHKR